MGDAFKREFSLGQVDTGRPYTGKDLAYGQGTSTKMIPNAAPVPDIITAPGQSVPGMPGDQTPKTTVTRPTFLTAFLQNLAPAISGAMSAPRGSGIPGGIGGGLKGIEEEADKQVARRREQQQMDLQQQSLQLRQQQEADIQKLHEQQFKNYQSLIETRANPPAKNQIEQFMRDYSDALSKGDQAGADTALAKIQAVKVAGTAPKAPKADNEISLIQKANDGDEDAAKALKILQDRRTAIAKQRGGSQYANFFDPELGRNVRMNNVDAANATSQGKILIPAGTVPATQIIQTQRAQSAIPKAVAELRKHLGAWDDAGDKAIFARIIKENPADSGDPSSWLGTILNNKLTGDLSPEGQQAVIALRRLNDSLGSLRVVAGLPATAGSQITTAALAPGASSPNSKFAGQQLDSILQLVEQETGVPFLGMNKKNKNSGGERVIDLR